MSMTTPQTYFNPRPPRGGRLVRSYFHTSQQAFQSTPPARGATLSDALSCKVTQISIHAPREGGDDRSPRGALYSRKFQSTPPARGATASASTASRPRAFQSTPPARGATPPARPRCSPRRYFNPRPPRGGRLCVISLPLIYHSFQSTPPARGATAKMHSFTCGSLTNK